MSLEPEMLKSLVKAAAEQVIASAAELTVLDQAIGDGDHGANMKRGFEAVLGKLDTIAALPPGEALKSIGKTLVMTCWRRVRVRFMEASFLRPGMPWRTNDCRPIWRTFSAAASTPSVRAGVPRPEKRPCSMFCSRCSRR